MATGLLSGGIHEFQELHMIKVGIEQAWSLKGLLDLFNWCMLRLF